MLQLTNNRYNFEILSASVKYLTIIFMIMYMKYKNGKLRFHEIIV